MFRAFLTVSVLTLLSRISGLVRDVLLARLFGASAMTDAFWIAFRIPNLLRRLFAEGAFSQAFIPLLSQAKAQEPETLRTFIAHIALLLSITLFVLSLIGVIGAPLLVYALAGGLPQETHDHTVLMTRIMFPYIALISLTAMASAILNTWQRFAIPAFTPVLLNLSIIATGLWLKAYFSEPIYALTLGVMLGGLLQLALQLVALWKIGILPAWHIRLRQAWQHPKVRRLLALMLPATLGVSVAQLSILINTNIASWLAPGSVTWLSFADRLMELPNALLGVALGTVLMSRLSQSVAQGQMQTYSRLLDWALQICFLLGLPCVIGLLLFHEPLVASLFHYGAFSWHDVRMSAQALAYYGIGLIGVLLVKVLAPGYYAQQNIKTPVRIAIGVLIFTQALNLITVPLWQHAGLTLSIALGAMLNAGMLYLGLRSNYHSERCWPVFFLRQLPALMALALCLWFAQRWGYWNIEAPSARLSQLQTYLPWLSPTLWRLSHLIASLALAGLSYFGLLYATGFRPRDLIAKSDVAKNS